MLNNKNNQLESEALEQEGAYFSTPSTSSVSQQQRTIKNFNSFDETNESYRKSTSRIVLKKYIIK